MTHRSDRVYLHAFNPRCDPSKVCLQKLNCARYMAALPPSGAKLVDASVLQSLWPVCLAMLPINYLTRPRAPDAPGPRVHPPLGSAS